MDSSDDDNIDLSEEEFKKNRVIEEMQHHTFMYDKSDPYHSHREKQIAVYEAIGAVLGIECR